MKNIKRVDVTEKKFIPRNEHYCAEVSEQEEQLQFIYTTAIYIPIKTFTSLVNNRTWILDTQAENSRGFMKRVLWRIF